MLSKSELIDVIQENDTVTGETTISYINALNWNCGTKLSKTIFLENTHGSYGLKYKVLTYAYKDGIEYEEISETLLPAGDIMQVNLAHPYAVVKVQVKDSVSGSHATYQLDYIGILG